MSWEGRLPLHPWIQSSSPILHARVGTSALEREPSIQMLIWSDFKRNVWNFPFDGLPHIHGNQCLLSPTPFLISTWSWTADSPLQCTNLDKYSWVVNHTRLKWNQLKVTCSRFWPPANFPLKRHCTCRYRTQERSDFLSQRIANSDLQLQYASAGKLAPKLSSTYLWSSKGH